MPYLRTPRSAGRALLALAIIFLSAAALTAQVPRELTYQGILRTTTGVLLNGPQNVRFNIFTSPVGGAALWSELHAGGGAIQVTNGLFTTRLGVITPFPMTLDFGIQYWLEIEYPVGTPLVPRTQLAAAPYAIHSALADAIPGAYQWTLAGGYLFPSSPNTNAPLAIGGTGAPPPGAGRLNVWGDPAEQTVVRIEPVPTGGPLTALTAGAVLTPGPATGIDLLQVNSNAAVAMGIRSNVFGFAAGIGYQNSTTSPGQATGLDATVFSTGGVTSYGARLVNNTGAGGPQYGAHATVAAAPNGAAVYAQGAGTAGAGAPNAAALELNDGAFNITGPTQAAGTMLVPVPAGMQQCVVTIANPLVTPSSRILVTVEDNSGVVTGTVVQAFAAIVSAKIPGQFDVNYFALTPAPPALNCAGVPIPVTGTILIHYLIIGP